MKAGIRTVVAVFLQEGKLLTERRGTIRRTYAGFLMCPSGHIKEGETRRQALFREMREELGIQVINARYLFSINDVDPWSGRNYLHDFMLIDSYQGTVIESNEAKDLKWLTYAQVSKEKTAPIVHELVSRLHDQDLF